MQAADPRETDPLLLHEGHDNSSNPDGHNDRLHRGLSARQVTMVALGGAIGTGLFLGTGRSLAAGGPGTMLVCYTITGFIVYITLLLLGEMSTQYPVAGSFTSYATRFIEDAYGFALSWNYWLNDAVSVASDLTAAQLILEFWRVKIPGWLVSLVILLTLVSANAMHVKVYGELEYWLSSIKIVTVLIFIITGTLVDGGLNREHKPIGFVNWTIGDAPFVGGLSGFATVFVAAAMSYGGTESLAISAGETRDPTRAIPRVVRTVFFRIVIFYLFTCVVIGLNVPYTYPNLSNKTTTTSPFTIVFTLAGSNIAASLMNTVILTTVLSAGNHALFAGTRILYSLAKSDQAPKIFARTSEKGVPWVALLATSSGSALCFTTSAIGKGELWFWLQNLVGVSNQIAWLSIGIASWRFRKAWELQGHSLNELLFHPRWTKTWGPPFVVFSVVLIMIGTSFRVSVQTYSVIGSRFVFLDFLSLYLQIPLFCIFYVGWKIWRRSQPVDLKGVDLQADQYIADAATQTILDAEEEHRQVRLHGSHRWRWRIYYWLV